MTKQPRIGYVLSSGGVRGVFAHTGFLVALKELNIPVVAGAGCSAGAVVGGIVASGTDPGKWAAALSEVTRKQFWTPDPLWRFLWNMTVRRGRGYLGLSDTSAAAEFCRQNMIARTFEDCQYPFYTIAVSLARSKKVVFSSGELIPRMIASSAMPILYRPVEIDGDLYCDGALIDFAPTDSICCKQSLDVVIVHHVSPRIATDTAGLKAAVNKPWAVIEVLNRLLFRQRPWYLSDEPISFQRCPCGCGAVVVVLEPQLAPLSWPVTKEGPMILGETRNQIHKLLKPFYQDLITDPRGKLPSPELGRDSKQVP